MKHGKLKAEFISKDKRFNSSFFLNGDAINSRVIEINKDKCLPLGEMAKVFNPPIFKRQFCQKTERAIPYCQSSDVTNALEGSDVYINKQQAVKVGSIVKKNQTLITGFGTIGNTRLVNELSDGISYANNVCRVECNEGIKFGYIYAFLSSKYGVSQINKNASGSVVRYIEAPGIKKTLVPILPIEKQKEIHDLIDQASIFRVESNKILNEAITYFENKIGISSIGKGFQVDKINSNQIFLFHKRLDSQFNIIWKKLNSEQNKSILYRKIEGLSSNIFVGGRGKRMYVKKGIPFLSSSEMMLFNPIRRCKMVSNNTYGIKDMLVSKYDILISRSGTVGNTVIVGDDLAGTAISEHALRVVIDKSKISPNYVFCFLKTKYGLRTMEASSFGSVIITLNEDLIGNIEIPILPGNDQQFIIDKIESYIFKMDEATKAENQAIDLIEKEIESWQE